MLKQDLQLYQFIQLKSRINNLMNKYNPFLTLILKQTSVSEKKLYIIIYYYLFLKYWIQINL